MFAIGHFALGYLTGKGSSRLLKAKINMPLLLVASVVPDIDLILRAINPTLFIHRGPTHSIITFTLILIPFFIIYKKQAIPYYAALLSHSLIGDLFTGGIKLFWPISDGWFGNNLIPMASSAEIIAEFGLFVVATTIMFKAKDLQTLIRPKNHNLILIVAFGAVLVPLLSAGQAFDSALPLLLVPPSIFWLILFSYSMLVGLRARPENPPSNDPSKEHPG
jgi:membrane-bound metal-dependent hydrolase YbcI (DUF457 family)